VIFAKKEFNMIVFRGQFFGKFYKIFFNAKIKKNGYKTGLSFKKNKDLNENYFFRV